VHADGHERTARLKREVDAPLAQLVLDLEARGLLGRTLVVLASEFSRSMLVEGNAATEAAEREFERRNGAKAAVPDALTEPKHYGLHRHFNGAGSVVLFGGGVKAGYCHGRTADEPPFDVVGEAVEMPALFATVYRALGIPPDLSYEVEGRPFFVTPDGRGRPVTELFA
jgi:hypothetical protein